MSHTSQRRGLSSKIAYREIIVLGMVPVQYKGKDGIMDAMSELAQIMIQHDPHNWILRNFTDITLPPLGKAQGLLEQLHKYWPDQIEELLMKRIGKRSSVVTALYTDPQNVINLLHELKSSWIPRNREKKYPISLVLSGLPADIHKCCEETNCSEHTYLHSLGFFGKKRELPTEDELTLLTMCGHGLISVYNIRDLVARIQSGNITPEQAATEIAKPCVCGITNRERAEAILAKMAG